MQTIIFTDLDGTLLDASDYSFGAAQPALDRIAALGVPLVLCSSKTRTEIELYRGRLQNVHPFIVENGGAVIAPVASFGFLRSVLPQGGFVTTAFGMPYATVRRRFVALRERRDAAVRGFGDMTAEEVAVLTGLPLAEAELARQREFAEPFVFADGVPDERFLQGLKEEGLSWTQGRLYCAMGNHDKGRAVRLLKEWYVGEFGTIRVICLGDALNDLPLLREADYPVLIAKPDKSFDERIKLPGLVKPRGAGPAGWNQAVLELLR